jgi:hypothetical protein
MAVSTTPRTVASKPLPEMQRQDAWWIEPVLVVATLVLFIIYGTFRAFENNFYDTVRIVEAHGIGFFGGYAPHYLSPFYSPPIQDWYQSFFHKAMPLSPSLLLLAFPGSFRASCYFARRSYYRAFFWDPPACAVREIAHARRKNYTGERDFPFNLQNLHRYALYAIFIVVAFHWAHLVQALFFTDTVGKTHFGIGVGTLIIAVDTAMLSLYVFSCHSFRHLIGGVLNRFSSNKTRFNVWMNVSKLNARHGLYFWVSLITVGLADVYIRLVCTGALRDLHIVF